MAMTRVDLVSLLSERKVVHPTAIARGVLEGRNFRVVVVGHPWWRCDPAPKSENVIHLIFENISQGLLDLPLTDEDWDEGLDTFSITGLEGVAWAQPSLRQIFCSAPTPDPIRFYALLTAYLKAEGAFTSAAHYLNGGSEPHRFVETLGSPGYLIATAPEAIARIVCAELDRQGVPHTVQGSVSTTPDTRLWVKLGDANFVCGRAFAEFESEP
ncbi:MAG: hypothetical protein PSX79_12775 [bacterium]|nr:hypothetical protein [bacterium]